jgi:hypothetical protein
LWQILWAGAKNTKTMTVKEKPYKAGIDPYNKLIDRVATDNVKVVSEE